MSVVPIGRPSENKWADAYRDLECEVRDLRRAIQIARLMDDNSDDDDPDSSGRIRLAIEYAERAADELVEKWDEGHRVASGKA